MEDQRDDDRMDGRGSSSKSTLNQETKLPSTRVSTVETTGKLFDRQVLCCICIVSACVFMESTSYLPTAGSSTPWKPYNHR